MKAKSLSTNILKNTVKKWGKFCKASEDFIWTQHDENAITLIDEHVKKKHHERYLRERAVKINPYLDPKQPYHTT